MPSLLRFLTVVALVLPAAAWAGKAAPGRSPGRATTLEPGKSADIAVWDQDMTALPTAQVKDLKCQWTLFRGGVVYQAPPGAATP
jgi:predicted amidohydrolase YtcJ